MAGYVCVVGVGVRKEDRVPPEATKHRHGSSVLQVLKLGPQFQQLRAKAQLASLLPGCPKGAKSPLCELSVP